MTEPMGKWLEKRVEEGDKKYKEYMENFDYDIEEKKPEPMADWTGTDILACPSYQKLFVVVKRCGRKYLLRRIRRNKHGLYAAERSWREFAFVFLPGEMIMIDEKGEMLRLRPQDKLKNMIEERIL